MFATLFLRLSGSLGLNFYSKVPFCLNSDIDLFLAAR